MAATPKRSLKRTVASTVEERSPRFLLGSLALAMVISLLAGLGIGIKIGKNDESNNATPVAKTKPTTTKPKTATRPKNPLVGTIVGKTPQRIVVATRTGRVRTRVLPNTVIHVTTAATTADIKPGSHVLFALKPVAGTPSATTPTGLTSSSVSATPTTTKGGPLTASEIIIVTGTRKSRAGVPVSSVTSDSMTFKLPSGRPLTISTAAARVVKTIPGKRVNLATGKHVLVQWFLTRPQKQAKNAKNAKKKAPVRFRIALEIVVLPVATTFA